MPNRKDIFKLVMDFVETLVIAAGVFIFVYLFIGQLLRVTGDSMMPTFADGEQIIAEKLSVKFNPIKRGQIVIFKLPKNQERLLIKRVVGLPGENIKISGGTVFINDVKLEEPYVHNELTTQERAMTENIEYKIQPDFYVVMGDNRENSSDSREFGPVAKDLIIGKAFMVYFPFNKIRFI